MNIKNKETGEIMKLRDFFCIFCIIMIVLSIWKFGNSYNVKEISEEKASPAWQELMSAYKSREDIAVTIVEAVDKYNINDKRNLVLAVVTARGKASLVTPTANEFNNSQAINSQFKLVQDELGRTLADLIDALSEIPEIKTDVDFNELKSSLNESNDKIKTSLVKYDRRAREDKLGKNMIRTSFWR